MNKVMFLVGFNFKHSNLEMESGVRPNPVITEKTVLITIIIYLLTNMCVH